jgi:DNA-binding SARP family transcriptional activator
MQISILGPLEVVAPKGRIGFTARRQQIVLATMLWNANRVVPMEVLIDSVWGQAPPATARSQVHICVSGIRKRLDRSGLHTLLTTRPPGYQAWVRPGQLDLHVFNDHVDRARALRAADRMPEASDEFACALRLWRGEPFSGIQSDRVATIATQLADRRIGVLEEYFDIQIAMGRSAVVISELTALVEEHPYRELLRGQLMTALCRVGRQVEALREYRDTRALFARELGLEPSRPLRTLEREILSGTDFGPPDTPFDLVRPRTGSPIPVPAAEPAIRA